MRPVKCSVCIFVSLFVCTVSLAINDTNEVASSTIASTVTLPPPSNNSITDECERLGVDAEISAYQVMMFSDDQFPRSEADVIKYCKEGDVAIKKFSAYRKCLKGLPRQVFSVVRGNIKSVVKDICSTSEKRLEMVQHAKCLDTAHMPEILRLLDIYANYINLIAFNTTLNDMIPRACCAVLTGKDLVYEKVGDMCDSVSGPQTKEFIVSVIQRVASEALDLACGQYSTMDDCKQKQNDFVITLQTIANETKVASTDIVEAVRKRKSFLIRPMLKIANDLTL